MINFRIKIRPTVLFVFALLVGIAVLTTLGIQYYFSKKLAFASIEESVQHISEKTQQKIESFNKSNYDLLSVLQYSHTLLQHPKEEQNLEFLKTFTTAISNNPYVYALYIGFENGDFYEVINLDIDDSLRVKFSASNKEKWFVVKIFKHHSTPIRLEQFLDKNFHVVRSVQKKVDYNPILRPWYQKALTSQEAVVTAPYSFANLDGMGVTYAQKIEQTNNVLGLDVSLRSFSSFLEAQKIVQKSHLYIFDQHNRVIASNISDEKAYFKNIDSILAQSLKNNDNTMTINHEEYFVSHYYLNSKSNSYLSIFVPEYEILKPFNEKINQGEDEKSVKQWLEKEQQTLQEEFEFIANANKGGEFMSQEDQEKIKEIAQRQWKAYFDDALGLSHDEQVRYVKNESKVEHLLDNKPHHLIPRSPKSVSDYDKYGFKVDIPNDLYNLGEIYNLCIQKGTLTPEERFKINEHMTMTIKMLEQLPFPENLKRVPEYAAAHHETLIGTGYPRKLTKEQMSIPARIMAIADVFEALTAADRPYKEAKKLSESIKILSFMVKDQHLDEDIFKLFLQSGVYLTYAKAYLKEDQIDEVDISTYV